MAEHKFVLVDVFTTKPLSGNPLAVLTKAEGMTEETLCAIAREFGYAETTFVLPPRDPRATRRLRFFTPAGVEVYGAGHNALGAWWVLAECGELPLSSQDHFHQEIGADVSRVTIVSKNGRPESVTMEQKPAEFGPVVEERDALARALGLEAPVLEVRGLEPQAVSTGAWHLLVPARDRSALKKVRVDPERLVAVAQTVGCHGCYLFCLDPLEPGSTAQARAFNPGIGISEDPATGSAAGPLAAYLKARGAVREQVVIVEQGHQMGRPSRIEVELSGTGVAVRGSAVLVGEGVLRL